MYIYKKYMIYIKMNQGGPKFSGAKGTSGFRIVI